MLRSRIIKTADALEQGADIIMCAIEADKGYDTQEALYAQAQWEQAEYLSVKLSSVYPYVSSSKLCSILKDEVSYRKLIWDRFVNKYFYESAISIEARAKYYITLQLCIELGIIDSEDVSRETLADNIDLG